MVHSGDGAISATAYAYLTLIKEGKALQVFELRQDEVLIGRDYKTCHVPIPLEFSAVGKIHVRLTHTGGEIFIEGLHNNGTYINGKLVHKHEKVSLKSNQLLTLGGQYLNTKVCALEFSLEKPQSPSIPSTVDAHSQAGLVKVLFLAANPLDSTRLRVDEEHRSIDLALYQTEFRDTFDLRQCSAVRISDLHTCLLRHKPTIVHFSGHGSASSEIILEDNFGDSIPVPNQALSSLFSILKDTIHCVILNACYTKQQARAIADHIDCVIGISHAIDDQSAIAFATAFYRALGFGLDVATAFELGVNEIGLSYLPDEDKVELLAIKRDPKTVTFIRK